MKNPSETNPFFLYSLSLIFQHIFHYMNTFTFVCFFFNEHFSSLSSSFSSVSFNVNVLSLPLPFTPTVYYLPSFFFRWSSPLTSAILSPLLDLEVLPPPFSLFFSYPRPPLNLSLLLPSPYSLIGFSPPLKIFLILLSSSIFSALLSLENIPNFPPFLSLLNSPHLNISLILLSHYP